MAGEDDLGSCVATLGRECGDDWVRAVVEREVAEPGGGAVFAHGALVGGWAPATAKVDEFLVQALAAGGGAHRAAEDLDWDEVVAVRLAVCVW